MPPTDPHYRFLLDCLRGSASSVPENVAWRWEKFIEAASNESLLPAVYGLLQRAGLLPRVPEDIAGFFFAARELNRDRNREILERLGVVAAALNRAGVEPLILKGLAYLLTGVYEDSADRFLVDIDLLVAKHEIPATLEVMRALGYSTEEVDPIDRATNHAYAVFSRSDSMTIDLHQAVGLGVSRLVLPAAEMLSRSVLFDFQGTRVRIPRPEDLLAHHILHAQVHEFYRDRIWPRYRPMYDLTLLQRRYASTIDWSEIVERFKSRRVYGVLALYLAQVDRTLHFKVPAVLTFGPLLRLRGRHRQLLQRLPTLRFIDPFWFYASGIEPRTRRLGEIIQQPGGVRYLLRKLFSIGFFSRLKTDLS
jgi:Uncharacterised nucleotidyltransferase